MVAPAGGTGSGSKTTQHAEGNIRSGINFSNLPAIKADISKALGDDRSARRRIYRDVLPNDQNFSFFTAAYHPDVHRRFSGGMDVTQKQNLFGTLVDPAPLALATSAYLNFLFPEDNEIRKLAEKFKQEDPKAFERGRQAQQLLKALQDLGGDHATQMLGIIGEPDLVKRFTSGMDLTQKVTLLISTTKDSPSDLLKRLEREGVKIPPDPLLHETPIQARPQAPAGAPTNPGYGSGVFRPETRVEQPAETAPVQDNRPIPRDLLQLNGGNDPRLTDDNFLMSLDQALLVEALGRANISLHQHGTPVVLPAAGLNAAMRMISLKAMFSTSPQFKGAVAIALNALFLERRISASSVGRTSTAVSTQQIGNVQVTGIGSTVQITQNEKGSQTVGSIIVGQGSEVRIGNQIIPSTIQKGSKEEAKLRAILRKLDPNPTDPRRTNEKKWQLLTFYLGNRELNCTNANQVVDFVISGRLLLDQLAEDLNSINGAESLGAEITELAESIVQQTAPANATLLQRNSEGAKELRRTLSNLDPAATPERNKKLFKWLNESLSSLYPAGFSDVDAMMEAVFSGRLTLDYLADQIKVIEGYGHCPQGTSENVRNISKPSSQTPIKETLEQKLGRLSSNERKIVVHAMLIESAHSQHIGAEFIQRALAWLQGETYSATAVLSLINSIKNGRPEHGQSAEKSLEAKIDLRNRLESVKDKKNLLETFWRFLSSHVTPHHNNDYSSKLYWKVANSQNPASEIIDVLREISESDREVAKALEGSLEKWAPSLPTHTAPVSSTSSPTNRTDLLTPSQRERLTTLLNSLGKHPERLSDHPGMGLLYDVTHALYALKKTRVPGTSNFEVMISVKPEYIIDLLNSGKATFEELATVMNHCKVRSQAVAELQGIQQNSHTPPKPVLTQEQEKALTESLRVLTALGLELDLVKGPLTSTVTDTSARRVKTTVTPEEIVRLIQDRKATVQALCTILAFNQVPTFFNQLISAIPSRDSSVEIFQHTELKPVSLTPDQEKRLADILKSVESVGTYTSTVSKHIRELNRISGDTRGVLDLIRAGKASLNQLILLLQFANTDAQIIQAVKDLPSFKVTSTGQSAAPVPEKIQLIRNLFSKLFRSEAEVRNFLEPMFSLTGGADRITTEKMLDIAAQWSVQDTDNAAAKFVRQFPEHRSLIIDVFTQIKHGTGSTPPVESPRTPVPPPPPPRRPVTQTLEKRLVALKSDKLREVFWEAMVQAFPSNYHDYMTDTVMPEFDDSPTAETVLEFIKTMKGHDAELGQALEKALEAKVPATAAAVPPPPPPSVRTPPAAVPTAHAQATNATFELSRATLKKVLLEVFPGSSLKNFVQTYFNEIYREIAATDESIDKIVSRLLEKPLNEIALKINEAKGKPVVTVKAEEAHPVQAEHQPTPYEKGVAQLKQLLAHMVVGKSGIDAFMLNWFEESYSSMGSEALPRDAQTTILFERVRPAAIFAALQRDDNYKRNAKSQYEIGQEVRRLTAEVEGKLKSSTPAAAIAPLRELLQETLRSFSDLDNFLFEFDEEGVRNAISLEKQMLYLFTHHKPAEIIAAMRQESAFNRIKDQRLVKFNELESFFKSEQGRSAQIPTREGYTPSSQSGNLGEIHEAAARGAAHDTRRAVQKGHGTRERLREEERERTSPPRAPKRGH